MQLTLTRKAALQTWREVLPFGIMQIVWGLANLIAFIHTTNSTVVPEQAYLFWSINIFGFILTGFGGLIYFTIKVKKHVSLFEKALDSLPCAIFISEINGRPVYYNMTARQLMAEGSLDALGIESRWNDEKVTIGNIEFCRIYTSGGVKYAHHERRILSQKNEYVGTVSMLFDTTHQLDTYHTQKELSAILLDLNIVLSETSNSYTESMRVLAQSTLEHALAFQDFAEYLSSLSEEVEMDTLILREKMGRMAGSFDTQNVTHKKAAAQLTKSLRLMEKTHDAVKQMASTYENSRI